MKKSGGVVEVVLALAFLGASSSAQEKQAQIEVKVISVSEESLERLGASFQGLDALSARQHFEKLVPVRDWITDFALSDQVAGQSLVIVRPEKGEKRAEEGETGIKVEGVDENGGIRLKSPSNFRIDVVSIQPERGEFQIDPELLKECVVKDLQPTLDLLKKLESVRQDYRDELTVILKKAKANESDENRKVADLARKSVQTTNFQRAVLDELIRTLRQTEKYIVKDEVLKITPIGDHKAGEVYPVADMVVLNRAKTSLGNWEETRQEKEAGL